MLQAIETNSKHVECLLKWVKNLHTSVQSISITLKIVYATVMCLILLFRLAIFSLCGKSLGDLQDLFRVAKMDATGIQSLQALGWMHVLGWKHNAFSEPT